MSMWIKWRSLAHFPGGMAVKTSPFNSVKIDIVLLLAGAALLWLLQTRMPESDLMQIGILFAYGLAASVWVSVKVRRIARRQAADMRDQHANPEKSG